MFRKLLLATAALVAPALAHADWYEADSKHFIVYSDDSPDRVRKFTERLERFDAALRYITGTPERNISPSARATVFMVSDVDAVQRLAGDSGVAGFFQNRASGPVAFVPRRTSGPLDAQTILMHEYGHNFMFSSWPGVVFAPWFVEGFAEFVGTAVFKDNGDLMLGRNPSYRSWSIDKSHDLPARTLVKLNPGTLDDEQRGALYARGWLLTHYLLMDKERSKQLADYMVAINSGKSVDEANRALGDISRLDGKLNSYYQKPTLSTITLTPAQVPIGTVTVKPVSAGQAATMPARILSSNGVDAKRAPGVAALARRLAAAYPNDAAAQNELAEAEFDARNYEAAEAAADRALAADAKSVHALLYKGMAQVELAKKAGVTDPEKWKAIRNWFVKANKLETEYAEPLIQYYDSFDAAKQAPSASAVNGLLYAYALAPFDYSVRFNAGKELLRQNQIPAARIAFEPLAYSGDAFQSKSNTPRDVLTALDSGGAPAALKVIADAEAKARKAEEEARAKAKAD